MPARPPADLVAQKCGFLSGQLPQRRKIETICNAGMEKAHHQKADPPAAGQRSQRHAAGAGHIRDQDNNGRSKLQKGSLYPRHAFDKLIEKNHGGIKNRSAHAEQNADVIGPAAHAGHIDDQYQAKRGHGKADHLLDRQLFVKQKRASPR